MRFERFVFKNQLERELLIGFTEHELHELHEYVAESLKIREIQEIRVQKSTLNIIS